VQVSHTERRKRADRWCISIREVPIDWKLFHIASTVLRNEWSMCSRQS